MEHDTAWVIESPRLAQTLGCPAMYWAGGDAWSPDHEDAVRFARDVDATRVLLSLETGVFGARAAEHMWCSAHDGE